MIQIQLIGNVQFTIKVTVKEDEMKYVIYGISCNLTNISLNNWYGAKIRPETYQWTNDSCDDNYKLTFLESVNNISFVFLVEWTTEAYNLTKLPADYINQLLIINGYHIDVPEIWEVDEAV
jgi:hypothetical protein